MGEEEVEDAHSRALPCLRTLGDLETEEEESGNQMSDFLDPDAEIQVDALIEPPESELIAMGLDDRGDLTHFDGPGEIFPRDEEEN
jgi:hypothetical protein